jgi:hypothetical protein
MAFGQIPLRQPRTPGRHEGVIVDPEADAILRRPDPGAAFPTTIYYAPNMIGVDFVSTDNINLESIIAEHVAFVESTPIQFNIDQALTTATMEWRDNTGFLRAEIRFDNTIFGPSYGMNISVFDRVALVASRDAHAITGPMSYVALTGGSTSALAQLTASNLLVSSSSVVVNAIGSQAEFSAIMSNVPSGVQARIYFAANITQVNTISVADVSSRVRFDVMAGAPAVSVDIIAGNVMFNTPTYGTCTAAGQNVLGGVRAVATAATQAWGSHLNWRHIRSDAAGVNFVTPVSVTIGGSFVSTNAVTNQVRFLNSLGGIYTCNSIAAGVLDILVVITVN